MTQHVYVHGAAPKTKTGRELHLVLWPGKSSVENGVVYCPNENVLLNMFVKLFVPQSVSIHVSAKDEMNARRVYSEVFPIIDRLVSYRTFMLGTFRNVAKDISTQTMINTEAFCNANDVRVLKNAATSTPAIIASAGPSLRKNIHLVDKTKAIVFGIGRTIQMLDAGGNTPDFVIQLEARDFSRFVDGVDMSNINAIFAEQTHEKMWALPWSQIYRYMTPANPIGAHMRKVGKLKCSQMVTSGSAGCDAVEVAAMMGCDPIIMIGQDLSVDGGDYADKNETCGYDAVFDVPGWHGGLVKTRNNYAMFRKWMSERAEVTKSRLWNCTEGGAYIDGWEHMTLKTALEKLGEIERHPWPTGGVIKNDTTDEWAKALSACHEIQSCDSAKLMKSVWHPLLDGWAQAEIDRFRSRYRAGDSVPEIRAELLSGLKNAANYAAEQIEKFLNV